MPKILRPPGVKGGPDTYTQSRWIVARCIARDVQAALADRAGTLAPAQPHHAAPPAGAHDAADPARPCDQAPTSKPRL